MKMIYCLMMLQFGKKKYIVIFLRLDTLDHNLVFDKDEKQSKKNAISLYLKRDKVILKRTQCKN